MSDVVDVATRSRMMSGIRAKNTQPEVLVRKALHRRGFRYRLHVKDLPGHPDMVFPKYRAVIFTHGCFWHGHTCPLFKVPQTRRDFWVEKIEGNRQRDKRVLDALNQMGWRVLVIWECALRGKAARNRLDETVGDIAEWLYHGQEFRLEIEGSR